MKCEITYDGYLIIIAENQTESYSLKRWGEANGGNSNIILKWNEKNE